MSPEIEFTQFVKAFGADPGVLPDGEVLESSHDDWNSVFKMLHASEWRVAVDDENSPLPASPADFPSGESFSVWPTPGLRVNFFYFREGVFFDIDLREMIGQAAADGLADLMRNLGTSLGRDVVIREEGTNGPPVVRYLAESDQFCWD